MTGRLMGHAFCAAFAAIVFGLCAGHTLFRHLDGVYTTGLILSAASLIFVLLRTQKVAKRFVASEPSQKSARQFLWSCVFFAMISEMFGLQVAGVSWFSTDFLRTFGFVFWGLLALVAIFPVRRDARRLARMIQEASK